MSVLPKHTSSSEYHLLLILDKINEINWSPLSSVFQQTQYVFTPD